VVPRIRLGATLGYLGATLRSQPGTPSARLWDRVSRILKASKGGLSGSMVWLITPKAGTSMGAYPGPADLLDWARAEGRLGCCIIQGDAWDIRASWLNESSAQSISTLLFALSWNGLLTVDALDTLSPAPSSTPSETAATAA